MTELQINVKQTDVEGVVKRNAGGKKDNETIEIFATSRAACGEKYDHGELETKNVPREL